MAGCFAVIWVCSFCQSKMIDMAFEEKVEDEAGGDTKYFIARCVSVIISAFIVLFNKELKILRNKYTSI